MPKIDQVIVSLRREHQEQIEAQCNEFTPRFECFCDPRRITCNAQNWVTTAFCSKHPSVPEVIVQTDFLHSTLRRVVEAITGKLGLEVVFPTQLLVWIGSLADKFQAPSKPNANLSGFRRRHA